jgi:hypothetical protein
MRREIAFVVAFALALTTVMAAPVFATGESVSENNKDSSGMTLPDILSRDGAQPTETYIREGLKNAGPGAAALGDALTDGKIAPRVAGDDPAAQGGGVSAKAYSFPSFNPGVDAPADIPENVATISDNKAGDSNKIIVTFAGYNQAEFFASCDLVDSNQGAGNPALIPAVNTVAYIPTDYQDSFGHSQGYYSYYDYPSSNDYRFDGPAFTYSDSFDKAGDLSVSIYYQKWTVADVTSGGAVIGQAWQPDTATRYVKTFQFNLLGVVYYYEYERDKTFKSVLVKNGDVYPKLATPKRTGFKFGGWYTKFPNGGSKITPGKTKVWFGEGYAKVALVRWNKTVKIKFQPNKGKITKGKKIVKVKYRGKLGKAPTVKRKGYAGLGWYYGSNHQLYKKGLLVLVPSATFKAQWIKKGKKATISSAEFNRISSAWGSGKKYVVTRKSAKAAIGGGGLFVDDGYLYGVIPAEIYEWNGTIDGSYVRIMFAKDGSYDNDILAISRVGPLK